MSEKSKFFSINFLVSKVSVFAIISLAIFVGVAYLLIEKPFYLILEPPFPNGVFTLNEEKSRIIRYSGQHGYPASHSYVWRKYYDIFPAENPDLGDQGQILAYLDKWLVKEGWKRWEGVGSPCAFLAEGDFLVSGKDFFPYIQIGKTSLFDTPAICIAVWPADKASDNFLVLVATSNN
jgi:hypothetical protein